MLQKELYAPPIAVPKPSGGLSSARVAIVAGLTGVAAIFLVQAQTAELQQRAAQIPQQLNTDPVAGLVNAIQATGQNRSRLPWRMLPAVQASLLEAVQTARERNRFEQPGQVETIDFSPDAQTIATAGESGQVYLWDWQGHLKQRLQGEGSAIGAIHFSPDGTAVVSNPADSTGTTQFWPLQDNTPYQPPPNPSRYFTAAAFADEPLVINGSNGGNVRLWNRQGELISSLYPPHSGSVTAVGMAGGSLVSAGAEGRIQFWNNKGDPLGQLWVGAPLQTMRLAQSGQRIITEAANRHQAWLWNAAAHQWQSFHLGDAPTVLAADLSPNQTRVVQGQSDGRIRVVPLDSSHSHWQSQTWLGHSGAVQTVRFSPEGQTVVSGGEDGTIRLWDLEEGTLITRFHLQQWSQTAPTAIALSGDGNQIAVGQADGTLVIQPLQQLAQQPSLVQLNSPAAKPIQLTWSADGQMVALHHEDGEQAGSTVHLRQRDGTELTRFALPSQSPIRQLALSPEGQRLIHVNAAGMMQLQAGPTALGAPLHLSQPLQFLKFSPDGQQVMASRLSTDSSQGNLCLWQVQPHRLVPARCQSITSQTATFSPDSQTILIGTKDGTLYHWQLRSNQLTSLPHPVPHLRTLAVAPDGQRFASGSADGTIRLFDAAGNPMGQPLSGHRAPIQSLAFQQQGKTLVSVAEDGEVRLWHASWEGWLQTACQRLHDHPVFRSPTTTAQRAAKAICQHQGQTAAAPPPAPPIPPHPIATQTPVRLVVKLGERRVYVYRGQQIEASYPVAIGQSGWETPLGTFKVFRMLQQPGWTHPLTGAILPPGANNPLGDRWMAFWSDGHHEIGFHGTPDRASIGTAASHGCLRLYNEDARALYQQIQLGTAVTIEP